MKEYPHIDTIWKRDQQGKIVPEYAAPEFEYLANNQWVGTEKVDGTNIRVMWDGERTTFGGKTDNAQIPAFLVSKLQEHFMGSQSWIDKFGDAPICLYGEGYGAKIQKGGGNYNPDGVDFVLFDVKVGGWWLKRDGIADIADYFNIGIVPIVFQGTLEEACRLVEAGQRSVWGDFMAEGLVLKPTVDLVKRNGDRIITKIKHRDYK